MKCNWCENSDGLWETDCNNIFELNDGTPEINGIVYCCYCGKEIEQIEYVEEVDEV